MDISYTIVLVFTCKIVMCYGSYSLYSNLESVNPSMDYERLLDPVHCIASPLTATMSHVVCSMGATDEEARRAVHLSLCRPTHVRQIKINCYFGKYTTDPHEQYTKPYYEFTEKAESNCWCGMVSHDVSAKTFGIVTHITEEHCHFDLDNPVISSMTNLFSLQLYGINISGTNFHNLDQIMELVLCKSYADNSTLLWDVIAMETVRVLSIRNDKYADDVENFVKPLTAFESIRISQFEITGSDLRIIPDHFFTYMNVTFSLSLAYNVLTELSGMVFQGLVSLRILDLSFNRINDIHPDAFKHLRNVNEIYLQGNDIKHLDKNAFINLSSNLPKLKLSNVTVSPEDIDIYNNIFRKIAGYDAITWVILNNIKNADNDISFFDYFSISAYLVTSSYEPRVIVDLRKNPLQHQEHCCFNIKSKIVARFMEDNICFCPVGDNMTDSINSNKIMCAKNEKQSREYNILDERSRNINNLSILKNESDVTHCDMCLILLSHNSIKIIPESTEWWPTLRANVSSKPSVRIYTFYLDYNLISTVSDKAWSNLNMHISYLFLNNNRLTHINHSTFQELSTLQIDLSNNNIHVISMDLIYRSGLVRFVCTNCSIAELTVPSTPKFNHKIKINSFSLTHNKLTHLSPGIFENLSDIINVYLFNNLIYIIEKHTFAALTYMKRLELQNNRLDLDFRSEYLNQNIKLTILNISSNFISFIGNLFNQRSMRNTEIIDLSNNFISNLTFLEFIEGAATKTLTLKNNSIYYIGQDTYLYLPHLEYLDLTDNKIHYFHMFFMTPLNIIVNLQRNPLHCSCELRWLRESAQLRNRYDIDSCTNLVTQHSTPFYLTPLLDFVCETPCEDTVCACHGPNTTSRDNNIAYVTHASCGSKHLKSVPSQLPRTLIHLNLTHNSLYHIGDADFLMMFSLRELFLSWNEIIQISTESFTHLEDLSLLALDHNRLQSVTFNLFKSLINLRTLLLNSNHIRTIDITISHVNMLKNIRSLHLSDNNINYLGENSCTGLLGFEGSAQVYLRHNPWDCQTCSAIPFRMCITGNLNLYKERTDVERWQCEHDKVFSSYLHVPLEQYKCIMSGSDVHVEILRFTIQHITIVLVADLLAVISFIIFILYKICPDYFQAVFYHIKLVLHRDGAKNRANHFDAFIIYESRDRIRRWVRDVLLRTLERDYGYSICIEERDFLAGCWHTEQILDIIMRSKRTIIVISQHIMDGADNATNRQALDIACRIRSKRQDHKLIYILFNDNIDKRYFSKEYKHLYAVCRLGLYLDRNKKWFWKKLLSRMPKL